jgi:uncharacterized protein YheU (UPF0270 family)
MTKTQAQQAAKNTWKQMVKDYIRREYTAYGLTINLAWLKVEISRYRDSVIIVFEPLTKSWDVQVG